MALFETKRRGYDKKQVDDYVFETNCANASPRPRAKTSG